LYRVSVPCSYTYRSGVAHLLHCTSKGLRPSCWIWCCAISSEPHYRFHVYQDSRSYYNCIQSQSSPYVLVASMHGTGRGCCAWFRPFPCGTGGTSGEAQVRFRYHCRVYQRKQLLIRRFQGILPQVSLGRVSLGVKAQPRATVSPFDVYAALYQTFTPCITIHAASDVSHTRSKWVRCGILGSLFTNPCRPFVLNSGFSPAFCFVLKAYALSSHINTPHNEDQAACPHPAQFVHDVNYTNLIPWIHVIFQAVLESHRELL
jgi:hypothetical protein